MTLVQETVALRSLGVPLAGTLFLPAGNQKSAAVLLCHGAGEFKEHYYELASHLAELGLAALALDMHGHGASGGERFHVRMQEWVADVQAAAEFLCQHTRIDGRRLGAFGLSSGGTAVLEAALVDARLKSLVVLGATVRNSLALPLAMTLRLCDALGRLKHSVTGRDLRIPLAKLGDFKVTADPEINRQLQADPAAVAAFMDYPFPGGTEAFFVNTIERAPGIKAPTLVLWGEEDLIDPPQTARLLFAALTCRKELHIIPGNGHLGHLDRNKQRVFALTGDWLSQTLA